jgi:O-antigen ligase
MMCAVLPEALRFGLVRNMIYILPFDMGIIRANGVGRFALLVIIISFVRMTTQTKGQRWFWLILLVSSLYLLLQTQSRSSLVGLAIAGILIVYLKGMDWRFIFIGPVVAYIIWLSGFQLRARGQIEELFFLTGREYLWKRGVALIEQSPILGCGFHADRIMLDFQHMHNSYFHALIQSGILGTLLFIGAIFGIWRFVFRNNLHKRVRNIQGTDQALLIESLIFLAFLTFRTLVESTGAFYGVDLLMLVPLICYIQWWNRETITKNAVR